MLDTESKFGSIKQESIIEPITDRSGLEPIEEKEKPRDIYKVEIVEPVQDIDGSIN